MIALVVLQCPAGGAQLLVDARGREAPPGRSLGHGDGGDGGLEGGDSGGVSFSDDDTCCC